MSYPIKLPLGSSAPLATLRHPTPIIWELEMHHGVDNRLNHEVMEKVFLKGLDLVEKDWRSSTTEDGAPGALIIIGKKTQQKFFSNGLDYENTSKDLGFFPNYYNPFMRRLLSFPMPVIAAVNGHCFAAAFVLALACDYRVMTSGRAWCCMNEIEFGAPMPSAMAAVLNYKLPTAHIVRKATLDAHRFTPQELHELGVVDVLADGGTEGVLREAYKLAESKAPRAKSGVYGLMKMDMMRTVLDATNLDQRKVMPDQAAALARSRL